MSPTALASPDGRAAAELYQSVLRTLWDAHVPFVAVGPLALRLLVPGLEDVPATECELVLPSTSLEALLGRVEALGFSVTAGGRAVRRPLDAEVLAGAQEVRAALGPLVVRGVFAGTAVPWLALWTRRVEKGGLPFACLEHQVAMLRARGRAEDLALVARVYLSKPSP